MIHLSNLILLASLALGSWPTIPEHDLFGPFAKFETIRARLALVEGASGVYVSEHEHNERRPTALLQAAVAGNLASVQAELKVTAARHSALSASFHGDLLRSTRNLLVMARRGCALNENTAQLQEVVTDAYEELVKELPAAVADSNTAPVAFRNFMRHFGDVLLHVEALDVLGIVHKQCYGSLPDGLHDGQGLLSVLRGYFAKNSFYLNDPAFKFIAEDFYTYLLGGAVVPSLPTWNAFTNGPDARTHRPDVFVIETQHVRVLRNQPYVFQLVPGIAEPMFEDPNTVSCPGENMELDAWKAYIASRNPKTRLKNTDVPPALRGTKMKIAQVKEYYRVIDDFAERSPTPLNADRFKKLFKKAQKALGRWYSGDAAVAEASYRQDERERTWSQSGSSLRLKASQSVAEPVHPRQSNESPYVHLAKYVPAGLQEASRAKTVLASRTAASKRKLAESQPQTSDSDTGRRLQDLYFGRVILPVRMRGHWACKSTVHYYRASPSDTSTEARGHCVPLPYGYYSEMCSNAVRRCDEPSVTKLVGEFYPFGLKTGVCGWRHRGPVMFDFGDARTKRVPTAPFPNFGGVLAVNTAWRWSPDSVQTQEVMQGARTRASGVGSVLVVAGSPGNWWVGLERLSVGRWRWMFKSGVMTRFRAAASDAFDVANDAVVKRIAVQVMGSNAVVMDADNKVELINVYLGVGNALRATTGHIVDMFEGSEPVSRPVPRRLDETVVPNVAGRLGVERDAVVHIGPLWALPYEYVSGVTGVDTPTWLPLTVGVEAVAERAALLGDQAIRSLPELNLLEDRNPLKHSRTPFPKVDASFFATLIKRGHYGLPPAGGAGEVQRWVEVLSDIGRKHKQLLAMQAELAAARQAAAKQAAAKQAAAKQAAAKQAAAKKVAAQRAAAQRGARVDARSESPVQTPTVEQASPVRDVVAAFETNEQANHVGDIVAAVETDEQANHVDDILAAVETNEHASRVGDIVAAVETNEQETVPNTVVDDLLQAISEKSQNNVADITEYMYSSNDVKESDLESQVEAEADGFFDEVLASEDDLAITVEDDPDSRVGDAEVLEETALDDWLSPSNLNVDAEASLAADDVVVEEVMADTHDYEEEKASPPRADFPDIGKNQLELPKEEHSVQGHDLPKQAVSRQNTTMAVWTIGLLVGLGVCAIGGGVLLVIRKGRQTFKSAKKAPVQDLEAGLSNVADQKIVLEQVAVAEEPGFVVEQQLMVPEDVLTEHKLVVDPLVADQLLVSAEKKGFETAQQPLMNQLLVAEEGTAAADQRVEATDEVLVKAESLDGDGLWWQRLGEWKTEEQLADIMAENAEMLTPDARKKLLLEFYVLLGIHFGAHDVRARAQSRQ